MTPITLAQPVLVTGATGFVGGRLARRLVQAGVQTRVLCRDPHVLAPDLAAHCTVVQGDLTHADSLIPAVAGVGTLFHCAANVATWDRRENYRAANVDGVVFLMQAIANTVQVPHSLVHVSTVDVYGYPPAPCDEAAPLTTRGFGYGVSKARGEAAFVAAARALGQHWCVLRPCNVMGPGSPFVERIGHELQHGLMLTVDGGTADCGYLDVDNLLDVMIWAAQAPGAHGQIFNVRDPVSIPWVRFITDLGAALHARGWMINLPWSAAMALAKAVALPYRIAAVQREPLLHPLIVSMFGRSCAHAIGRLQAAGAPLGKMDYNASMHAAIEAFRTPRLAA